MFADFIPKLLAESNDVVGRRWFAGNVGFHVPKPHVIEESKTREFPDRTLRKAVISAKINCACEDALKPVDETPVVGPVSREAEFFEHFGARTKPHTLALLPESERCNPDWNQPVLPKRQSEIRVSLDLKNEFPIPSCVEKRGFRRPSEGKPAENERA
jgi:hypothetical protein